MPACSVIGCKSVWKKDSKITFHRFPLKDKNLLKYWIAATGNNNLVSYLHARMCGLHFKNDDYFNHAKPVKRKSLKLEAFPTQYVHKNIIKILQDKVNKILQDKVDKINEYDKNDISINEEQNDKPIDEEEAYNQNNVMLIEEQVQQNDEPIDEEEANQNNVMLIDEKPNNIITSLISKCLNCEKLSVRNEMLHQKIKNLKILQKERLEQQANMFNTIIKRKEATLKKRLKLKIKHNKVLLKSTKCKERDIKNLKTLFKHLQNKNILADNDALKLSNEFGNLLVPLLQNEKKKKNKSCQGRRYSEKKDEHAITPNVDKLKKKGRNVSSTVNPLSESSTRIVSTNKVLSNEILESVKDIYGTNAAMSNTEYNNESDSSLNIVTDAVAHDSTSSDILMKGRQGLQLQQLLHNDECFKKFVISELLENASHQKKLLTHSLQKEDNDYRIDLPYINNVESLVQFDKKLKTDTVYRNNVISHMSKIGGKNYKKITMGILKTIIHCTLANKYSWKGRKGKLKFCRFKGLLSAVICATRRTEHGGRIIAVNATEEDVIGSIKDFLLQAIGRARAWEAKQQNEGSPDILDEYTQSE